ncbi:HD domain-containing protein [Helicobacter sp. faydin-H20]|uniref:HD domain-containing protein n=1 Tax=Helicobacter anatolicus TaxID=2905874 RepID=UPI001E5D8F2C|nr:HD domain-containing protein [Helicobacter anatolicus]MCE3037156.1 HD domain-containing protein [Helicobacter anatolicus]
MEQKLKKPRLSTSLLRHIFTAASIRRWNDQATPIEFTELDKQAHKFVIAYLFAKIEENEKKINIDWEKLILYFCFEFFSRIVLTDIKPPIFYALQKNYRDKLSIFVIEKLQNELSEYPFFDTMQNYLKNPPNTIETQILKAAHFYASKWEFDIIYHFNPYMYDVQNIKKSIDLEVENHYHLNGMQKTILFKNIQELITMFGQLRFQKRWSQTPRIPSTSVLGHTLVVAICGYLLSYDIDACKQMRINHFLCGIFHDLPEILTRDIISPIKQSVKGLDQQIKELEEKAVKEKILSIVPQNIADDIIYFTHNEFSNRYKISCFIENVEGEEIFKYNQDEYSPIYGEFLKICDLLSAYLEAKISIAHGISSKDLTEGAEVILKKCGAKVIKNIDIGSIFRDFE